MTREYVMTNERYQEAIDLLLTAPSARESDGSLRYHGFNGGGRATVKAKNFLRVLLSRHTGHPNAELLREYFNELRTSGDTISSTDVRFALEILKAV